MSSNSVYYVGGENTSATQNFTSWLDSLNPATFPYELIILLYVLVYGMQSQTVTVTDVADMSDASAQCQTDVSTMISELTTLQSASDEGGFNEDEFTVADLTTFTNAFYDLFVSDSANVSQQDLGINVDGTTYYPAVDASGGAYWTTTPPATDASASDLQMYMYYTAIYQCDMAYYDGGMSEVEGQSSTIFWGEGQGNESGDAALQTMQALWNWFDSEPFGGVVTFSESMTTWIESGGEQSDTSWSEIQNDNTTGGAELFFYIDELGYNQYESTQSGETSVLDTGIADMQTAQNAFSDESQQDANLIEQATEEIQSLSKLCQNATQEANQAILNSINSYRVA